MLANLVNVDPNLAGRVAGGLNMEVPDASPVAAPVQDLELSPALRIIGGPHELHTLKGRTVGILVADGSNRQSVDQLATNVREAGGRALIVAPKIGGTKMSDGSVLEADAQLAGFPSVMVDAIALELANKGCELLLR